jgi:hypothetical protein
MQSPTPIHPAERLLDAPQPSLSDWYGEPLNAAAATCLHTRAQLALQARLYANHGVFALHVLQFACDYWRRNGAPAYDTLLAAAGSRREQALLELVYGQLLIGRKLRVASMHLARGFELAAPWLASADYFELVRRHELLACLRLTDVPSLPQGLAALLAEAVVVRRLRNTNHRHSVGTHCDTLG